MLQYTESNAKFFLKRSVSAMRSIALGFFSVPVTKEGWEDRMLISNLEGLGDLIMFTSVLKHYKKRFPTKKIYLLVKQGFGVENFFREYYVDEVIALNYRRFSINPWYGFQVIRRLRRIGFHTVVNHDFSAAEIMGKIISVSLGAKEVIGYEGQIIEFEKPYDIQQEKHLKKIRKKILPRYTRIIPPIPQDIGKYGRIPSEIEYYIAIYEAVTGVCESDYAPMLPRPSDAMIESVVKKFDIPNIPYVVFNVNSSVSCKIWPFHNFAEVAGYLDKKGYAVVLVGSKKEFLRTQKFNSCTNVFCINTSGKTSFEELLALIAGCAFVFGNDTSTIHFAVALQRPSLCVVGGGQFGVAVNYGYRDMNVWAYEKTYCYFDNWRCSRGVAHNDPSPCVVAISVSQVLQKLNGILAYNGRHSCVFSANFEKDAYQSISHKKEKIKIIYSGIQAENYNPARKMSFEYSNFYNTLKDLPNVEVIEYPYDPIIEIGKKRFNEKLLDLVRREKPDLFFAFMFTDELDVEMLDEIKGITTSVAWFADDHWRLWNYSHRYAWHFSWVVTTWSKAPEIYRRYGITNVIRSQWACNPHAWKPVDIERDIDVAFVGQWNPSRAHIVEQLRKAGINVWTRGWGWPEGRLSHEEMVKSLSRAKINLNFNVPPSHWNPKMLARLLLRRSVGRIVPDVLNLKGNIESWFHMPIPQIKARPFEILACRTFLISGYADDMENYYENKKEIVYYNGQLDDLIGKIRYYLAHDDERENIAHAAYERTLREHTYEKRFREIFKKIGLT
ncbi:MAG: glycosyltransferase [Patescibacteria group bacterium]|nr:glycosyltransferase [Patescibacteria group bacterium]